MLRINPTGLIEAGGLKLTEGESFIHNNIGHKSIILFRATKERQQIFKGIYKQFMGSPIRVISSEQFEELVKLKGDQPSVWRKPEKK